MRLLVCVVFIFLAGCGEKMPADIIRPEKMKQVQWDLMQADEMADYYKALDTTYPADQKRKEHYAQILKIHAISQEQLDKTIDYYTARPALLKELLDSVQKLGERTIAASNIAPTQVLAEDTTALPKLRTDTVKLRNLLKRRAD